MFQDLFWDDWETHELLRSYHQQIEGKVNLKKIVDVTYLHFRSFQRTLFLRNLQVIINAVLLSNFPPLKNPCFFF